MSQPDDIDLLADEDICQACDGAGGCHDCGEDTCCCADPGGEDDFDWWDCHECGGTGEQ